MGGEGQRARGAVEREVGADLSEEGCPSRPVVDLQQAMFLRAYIFYNGRFDTQLPSMDTHLPAPMTFGLFHELPHRVHV